MDKAKMQEGIDQIIGGFLKMKQALGNETTVDDTLAAQSVSDPSADPSNDLDDFEKLKTALESDRWPEAVNKNLVCDPESESDKIERGRGVVDLMIEDALPNLRFLDFGCGEGHSALYVAEERAALSVGYDIKASDQWAKLPKLENLLLTADFEEVQRRGPYNAILLFDVIDHATHETPQDILKKAASLLADRGRVYLRAHPWTSRHATHLYHDLNKAYIHLIFKEEELDSLVKPRFREHNIGVKYPLMTYAGYFKAAGLKEVNRREIKEAVEPFFKIPKIAERIMKNTEFNQYPEFQMSLQFIDYVLEKV